MHSPTYALYLFNLLHKYRKKVEQKDADLNSARGLVFSTLIGIALWCIIISFAIVIFWYSMATRQLPSSSSFRFIRYWYSDPDSMQLWHWPRICSSHPWTWEKVSRSRRAAILLPTTSATSKKVSTSSVYWYPFTAVQSALPDDNAPIFTLPFFFLKSIPKLPIHNLTIPPMVVSFILHKSGRSVSYWGGPPYFFSKVNPKTADT